MPRHIDRRTEQVVLAHYDPRSSWNHMKRVLKEKNILIDRTTIKRIVNGEGKKREIELNGGTYKKYQPSIKVTPKVRNLIDKLSSQEHPLTQQQIADKARVCRSTVRNVIHDTLNKVTRQKTTVHVLNENEKKNRKKNCRKLYEKYLAGEKCNFVVTLDESWIKLKIDSGKTSFCYIKKGERVPEEWIKQTRTLWERKFMIVAAMCYFRTFPLIKIPDGVTMTSQVYVNRVLKPLIKNHLVKSFGDDISKVYIHHDKSPVHVSKFTTEYMETITQKYGIKFIAKEDIPVKGADCAPLDFFGFGHIKQSVERCEVKNLDQLWKLCKSIWRKVSPTTCANVYESWKKRCRTIHEKHGGHCEQVPGIHKHKKTLKELN